MSILTLKDWYQWNGTECIIIIRNFKMEKKKIINSSGYFHTFWLIIFYFTMLYYCYNNDENAKYFQTLIERLLNLIFGRMFTFIALFHQLKSLILLWKNLKGKLEKWIFTKNLTMILHLFILYTVNYDTKKDLSEIEISVKLWFHE